MKRSTTMVFALGAAFSLLMPTAAQANGGVEVNVSSSTQSTSTASTPGQSATTTTSGAGRTEVNVPGGGLHSLNVDSSGTSKTAAAAGPHGAAADGVSTNTSKVDVQCKTFGCNTHVHCPGFVCTTTGRHHPGVHHPGVHHPIVHHRPVFHHRPPVFVPVPTRTVTQEAGRNIQNCDETGGGLVSLNCVSLLNDLGVDLSLLNDLDLDLGNILDLGNVLGVIGDGTGGLNLLGVVGGGTGGLTGVLSGGLLSGLL